MESVFFPNQQLGLLVSVRNLEEAEIVSSVGVDVLDIKETRRGALGKAEDIEIGEIVQRLGEKNIISAALGEIGECESYLSQRKINPGLSLAKCGLAGSIDSDWRTRIEVVWGEIRKTCQPVAVAYADWLNCKSPSPMDILEMAIKHQLPYLLVDTFFKDGPSSLDLLTTDDLSQLRRKATENDLRVVLAGGLDHEHVARAFALGVDLIGVRGAVCRKNRNGNVDQEKVQKFKTMVKSFDHRSFFESSERI